MDADADAMEQSKGILRVRRALRRSRGRVGDAATARCSKSRADVFRGEGTFGNFLES